MAKISDTSPEADRVLTEVYRRMTPAQKWRQLGQMFRDARALHAMGMRMTNPSITLREITADWIRRNLGVELPVPPSDSRGVDTLATLQDFAEVALVFDRLGIRYALTGSLASSVYGISRFTNDADVIGLAFPGREKELLEVLGDEFYGDETAIRQAFAKKSSFNVINTRSGLKVDFFILSDELFEQSAWTRAVATEVGESGQKITILTIEDVILSKLRWYRLGGEPEDGLQWRDVIGVIKTKRTVLDLAYLERWATTLRVDDLLARALAEVPPA